MEFEWDPLKADKNVRKHGVSFHEAATVKKVNDRELDDELRSEYDLSQMKDGVRGKYAKRFREGTNLVLLSPDVALYFPDDDSVNAALRSLVSVAQTQLRHVH
jgi:hypothetical protein